MKIAVIGWYGHENAGDERILHCLRQWFDGDELVAFGDYEQAWQRRKELEQCDFVLLGGGGMIVRGVGEYAKIFESLRVPFGCVGLGVEARHRDNQRLIDVILERAEFIYVRDRASRQRLGGDRDVITAPDLTFLYPFDVAPWTDSQLCGLNLRPWSRWSAGFGFRSGPQRILESLDRRAPALASALPLRRWEPAQAIEIVRDRFDAIDPIALYEEAGVENDSTLLGKYFGKVHEPFDPMQLAACRYLVGMRYHSLVFACQMAIPFAAISYQPKCAAFCEEAGLGAYSVDVARIGRLAGVLAKLVDEAADLRAHLIDVREARCDSARSAMEWVRNRIRKKRRNSTISGSSR